MNTHQRSESRAPANEIRERLIQAGCYFDFRLGLWRCPACRTAYGLQLQPIQDGSILFACRRGCELGSILSALGLTFANVGPAEYRRRAA